MSKLGPRGIRWGAVLAVALWMCPIARAEAQRSDAGTPVVPTPVAGPDGGADALAGNPAPPVAPPQGSPAPVAVPTQEPPQMEVIALPPELAAPPSRRSKPLKSTLGIAPTAADLGSEADVVSSADETSPLPIIQTQKWTFSMKGYIRAPMRVSLGPRDDTMPGLQLHSPMRMVGFSSSNWSYIAIAPNPSGSLYATIGNPTVSGTLILTTGTFPQAGYDDIDSLGGISQGYVTMKFPDAFGSRGGLALTMGSFSNRYGTAGPNQTSSGFYSTYLFGRTHVTGEVLTADIDLTDHVELLLEHGAGAKLELMPFTGLSGKPMFIPGDSRVPLGSNFLHHAHAAIWIDKWLKVGAHYLTSWTPDDRAPSRFVTAGSGVGEGRLSVVGADVHFDHEKWGNGYIGYSHVWAHNLMPLDEALQVIHGGRGYDFKLQYFGNKLRAMGSTNFIPNDSGRVETILFQYILRSNALLGYSAAHRGLSLALYGMFSHAYSPPTYGTPPTPALAPPFSVNDNKLKYGALLEFAAFQYVSFGFRFDRVQPTSSDPTASYTALSPSVVIHSNWKSKEYIIVDYTRFFLGAHTFPDSPYSDVSYTASDPNVFVVSAIMSL